MPSSSGYLESLDIIYSFRDCMVRGQGKTSFDMSRGKAESGVKDSEAIFFTLLRTCSIQL